MKHYSAELQDLNDVAAGSNLEIKDGRTRSATIDTAAKADAVDGFVISGGDFAHILDGQGSGFAPNAGTKTNAGLINLVRSAALNGTNLELAYDSDFVHGTDVIATEGGFSIDLAAINSDTFIQSGVLVGTTLELYKAASTAGAADVSIDLSSLSTGGGGGGGGAADFNETNQTLPVLFVDDLGELDFTDSLISEVVGGGTITLPTTYAASVLAAVTSGSTVMFDGIQAGDQAAFHAQYSAGVASTTIAIGGIEFVGTLTSTAAGATATFVLAAGTFTNILEDAAAIFPRTAGVYSPDTVVIKGNLQIEGTQTTVNQTQVDLNDSFLNLNSIAPSDASADVVAADGGLIILTDVNAAADTAVYAGIRYDASEDEWQLAHNLTANTGAGTVGTNPDSANTWVPITVTGGATNKAVINIAETSNAITASVDGAAVTLTTEVTVRDVTTGATAGYYVNIDLVGTGALPIGSVDVTCQLYDGSSMIIPDEVIQGMAAGATGALATAATSIVVKLPAEFNPSTTLKIVIVG